MKALVAMLLALSALSNASAQSAYEVTESDRQFLADVFSAVGRKDAMWIASHSALPMAVVTGKVQRTIKKEEDFASVLASSLSTELIAGMQADAKKPLFKNWRDVMVGDGILWFEAFRVSERAPWRYMITAFGGFALQPSEKEPNSEGSVSP